MIKVEVIKDNVVAEGYVMPDEIKTQRENCRKIIRNNK